MRKHMLRIAATAVCILAMSFTAFAADLDLASLGDEELKQLYADVRQEMVSRNLPLSSEVTLREGKFIVGVHQAVHRIEALIHEREEVVFKSLIVGRELFLQFRILLESDRIKSLAAEKGARGFSHLFRIRDDVPHTHHEGVVFFENRFAIHPGNESILVSNGIATRENQGAERTKHKQSFFHKVLMNMCA